MLFSTTVGGGMAQSAVGVYNWLALIQTLDPSFVVDAPRVVQAAVLFLVMILFGCVAFYAYRGRIDEAVDASVERPLSSALYGVMAYGVVVFLTGYAYSQLSRLGIGTTTLSFLAVGVLAVILLTLGGFGFVVVGTILTEVVGGRDPRLGLVGVSGVSSVAWLLLPFVLGVVVWIGFAAVGIGGATRRWVHVSDTEPNSGP